MYALRLVISSLSTNSPTTSYHHLSPATSAPRHLGTLHLGCCSLFRHWLMVKGHPSCMMDTWLDVIGVAALGGGLSRSGSRPLGAFWRAHLLVIGPIYRHLIFRAALPGHTGETNRMRPTTPPCSHTIDAALDSLAPRAGTWPRGSHTRRSLGLAFFALASSGAHRAGVRAQLVLPHS
jgi:hypothetical protein